MPAATVGDDMAQPSGREIIERFARAIRDQDFAAQAALLADDFIDEMPQSGERTRGMANYLATLQNYPGGVGTVDPSRDRLVGSEDRWVLTPAFTQLRSEGSGDVYTYVGWVQYPSGEKWQVVLLIELRNGKIARTTSWYPAPFEAPAWRAPYVERFNPDGPNT
jgi:SnoaL-like domain